MNIVFKVLFNIVVAILIVMMGILANAPPLTLGAIATILFPFYLSLTDYLSHRVCKRRSTGIAKNI